MPTPATSPAVRAELVEALKLDLVGPNNDHAFAHELLPDAPSRWYLSGFLVPSEAPADQKTDETSTEEIDSGGDTGGSDDDTEPDRAAARKSILPSSMGLSVLVAPGVETLNALVAWGDYIYEGAENEPAISAPTPEPHPEAPDTLEETPSDYKAGSGAPPKPPKGYRRHPREDLVSIPLPAPGGKPKQFPVPNSGGLTLSVTVRAVPAAGHASTRLPAGARSVSVFLVNHRPPNQERGYRAFAFQTCLKLIAPQPFTPRPDLRGTLSGAATEEWDEQVADLQFRDVFEYAVGHGVSATAEHEPGGACRVVKTTWIPTAEVEKVSPASIPDVELRIEALGALADHAEAQAKLSPLVAHYREWLDDQQTKAAAANLEARHAQTAQDLILSARHTADRIQAGIDALADPQLLDAFRIANRAMAASARQRELIRHQGDASKVQPPTWYPFQLAYILMNLRGIFDPTHLDRETVDLLFFPTGGGKTEAYPVPGAATSLTATPSASFQASTRPPTCGLSASTLNAPSPATDSCRSSELTNPSTAACPPSSSPPLTNSPPCRGPAKREPFSVWLTVTTRKVFTAPAIRSTGKLSAALCRPRNSLFKTSCTLSPVPSERSPEFTKRPLTCSPLGPSAKSRSGPRSSPAPPPSGGPRLRSTPCSSVTMSPSSRRRATTGEIPSSP